MLLQDYIAALLKEHNCVIVPEFGGFVANYRSAVVDEFRKKIHPPSKSVLFNPHLTTNDGLLGNYISHDKSIDYSAALSFISNEVKDWSAKLVDGERIEVGEIGFLYSKNDKIQFEQSREVNLLLAAYGLKTIDFVDFTQKVKAVAVPKVEKVEEKKVETKPVIEQKPITERPVVEKPIEKKPVKTEEPKEKEVEVIALNVAEPIVEKTEASEQEAQVIPIKKSRLGTVAKYAVAVCIVPALFYSYWIPMETDALDTQSIQVSDFNPIHKQAQRTYRSRISEFKSEGITEHQSWEDLTAGINSDIYNLEYSEDFYVPIQILREEAEIVEDIDKTEVDLDPVNTTIESNDVVSSGDYHVISGCFGVKSNAEKLVADLKAQGFNAQIIDKKGGLHRVSAGGYSSRQDAKNAVGSVESSGFSGWVLKK
jgi:CCDC81-like prokaryotic HU domain 1/SPOR domain/CCDC81-like prokaryotic HU domain 2